MLIQIHYQKDSATIFVRQFDLDEKLTDAETYNYVAKKIDEAKEEYPPKTQLMICSEKSKHFIWNNSGTTLEG